MDPLMLIALAIGANQLSSATKSATEAAANLSKVFEQFPILKPWIEHRARLHAIRNYPSEFSELKKLGLPREQEIEAEKKFLGTEYLKALAEKEEAELGNLAEVSARAVQILPLGTRVNTLDEEFITFFASDARTASTEKAKDFYARILSVELTSSGSISKRALQELRVFDKHDSDALNAIASQTLFLDDPVMLLDQWEQPPTFAPRFTRDPIPYVTKDFMQHGLSLGILIPEPYEEKPHLILSYNKPIVIPLSNGIDTVTLRRTEMGGHGNALRGLKFTPLGSQLVVLPQVEPKLKIISKELLRFPSNEVEITSTNAELEDLLKERQPRILG